MKTEIQKRKRRFWSFCLALLLAWMQLAPQVVYATEYTLSGLNCETVTPATTYFLPGDTINYNHGSGNIAIKYYDTDGNEITSLAQNLSYTSTGSDSFTVKAYPSSGGQITDTSLFRGWKEKEGEEYNAGIYGSSGVLHKADFTAVEYKEYTISYNVDGNPLSSPSNPSTYYGGRDTIELLPEEKVGHSFSGWYTESEMTESSKKTKVTTEDETNLSLYGKFTPNVYEIHYDLGTGESVPAGQPTEYTYGVGIAVGELKDASKEGYDFVGWYSDEGRTTPVTSISTTSTGNITLYPKFTGKTYNIHYDLGTGESVPVANPTSYVFGVGVPTLNPAVKEGYTFEGWYRTIGDALSKVEGISATQIGDVTLTPKFTANTYSIDYILNDGVNAADNPTTYTYGDGVPASELKNATKTGHGFDGWYIDEDGDGVYTTKVTSIEANRTGNITLYAKFTPEEYAIEYETNGGTNAATNPSNYKYGVGVDSFADASKTGYTFVGWYSDAEFTTRVTSISSEQTDAVKLYAKFTENEYTITYETNGGTNAATNPSNYKYGTGVGSFADASKTGYTFVGWYSDAEFTTQVTSISSTKMENITLYAKFTANVYTITYETNGGTNPSTNPSNYKYGTGVDSFADASKTGYMFVGWYSDADFTTQITSISSTKMENITLYAKFTANVYTITYETYGGTNASDNPANYTYGDGIAEGGLKNASKTGYTFEGWYKESTFATKVTSIPATQMGDITLYANYVANDYGIIYVLDGGENAQENPSGYDYGVGVPNLADATKTGHTFGGWYTSNTFDAATKVTGIAATQAGNITLYAKFTANVYSITYELDGGTNAATNPTNYTYGVGASSFANATKTGYTFEGWYKEASFTTQITSIPSTRTGNITLYAKFKVQEETPLLEGVGSISVADIYYGKQIKPVVVSLTNGTEHVTITYKKKGAADSTYSQETPLKVGEYTACATFAKTETYTQVTATTDFSISYLPAPKEPYAISGTKGKNEYYTSKVTITPAQGYLIATALDGEYQETLEVQSSAEASKVYLKKTDTGEKTAGISLAAINIDQSAPSITGAEDGSTIYAKEVKLVVKDENLNVVKINGKNTDFTGKKATLVLSSDNGEETYEIVGRDLAGNTKKLTITVAAEWTKKREVPSGEKVKLYKNRSYQFGSKSFKVSGDTTTYAANSTFYVGDDGEYVFSEAN